MVLVPQLQMNVQNQFKTAVLEETFNKQFDQLFSMMATNQQSNIQYQINMRHMDGCLNKHKHAQGKENKTANTSQKVPMTNVINALGKVNSLAKEDINTELYYKQPHTSNLGGPIPMSASVTHRMNATNAKTSMELNNE